MATKKKTAASSKPKSKRPVGKAPARKPGGKPAGKKPARFSGAKAGPKAAAGGTFAKGPRGPKGPKGPKGARAAKGAKAGPKGAFRKGPVRGPVARTPGPRKAAALAPPPPGTAAAASAPAQAPDPSRPTALAIAKAGLDKLAEQVTVLDVRGLASYADYFVVMTADSDRQAGAIADHLESTMKEQGVGKVGVEGYEGGNWILVDYGDVVAHVMSRQSREMYDLEGLWADAPRFAVEG